MLKGKTALVTGGGSGIGFATARRFAGKGAAVVIVDIDEATGKSAADEIDATFVRADVGDWDEIENAVRTTIAEGGSLDIAYLNAGIVTGESDISKLSPAAYRRATGVNIDGVVYGAMAASRAMSDGGAIVATASLAGLLPYPVDPIYGLTKHAVVGFIRSIAEQLKPKGITANAVCPGIVDTPILDAFGEAFRRSGFPLLEATEIADAVLSIVTSKETGQAFVCQPGRPTEPYKFKGVPGPRVPGKEGMLPPF